MTTHMHDMAPGQRLDIKGPIVKYPIDQSNKHNHIAMISGGTGITPMYQVIRQLFKDPNDRTKVTLVFGNISEDDILLKRELHELENTYPQRFRAFYTLDKPPEGWTQGKGFITKDLLKTVLPEPKEDNIKIFVCGRKPPPHVASNAIILQQLTLASSTGTLQGHQWRQELSDRPGRAHWSSKGVGLQQGSSIQVLKHQIGQSSTAGMDASARLGASEPCRFRSKTHMIV